MLVQKYTSKKGKQNSRISYKIAQLSNLRGKEERKKILFKYISSFNSNIKAGIDTIHFFISIENT